MEPIILAIVLAILFLGLSIVVFGLYLVLSRRIKNQAKELEGLNKNMDWLLPLVNPLIEEDMKEKGNWGYGDKKNNL